MVPDAQAQLGGVEDGQLQQPQYSEGTVYKTRKPYTLTKQRERWTEDEHGRFLEALRLFGRQWRKIEEHVATKTAVQIRSHAQKFFNKLERKKEAGEAADAEEDISIPPPRPKRKPSRPYPRKDSLAALSASADVAYSADPTYGLHLGNGSQGAPLSSPFDSVGGAGVGAAAAGGGINGNASSADVNEATVQAVAAAASAAAAAAAAAVVAAAGPQVQSYLNVNPPQGFPFFGMPPAVLAQLSASAVAGNPAIAAFLVKQDPATEAVPMTVDLVPLPGNHMGKGFTPATTLAVTAVATGEGVQLGLHPMDIAALPIPAAAAAAGGGGSLSGRVPAADTPPERDDIDRALMMEETGTTEGSQGTRPPVGAAYGSDGDSACSHERTNDVRDPAANYLDAGSWQAQLGGPPGSSLPGLSAGSLDPSVVTAAAMGAPWALEAQLQWLAGGGGGVGGAGLGLAGGYPLQQAAQSLLGGASPMLLQGIPPEKLAALLASANANPGGLANSTLQGLLPGAANNANLAALAAAAVATSSGGVGGLNATSLAAALGTAAGLGAAGGSAGVGGGRVRSSGRKGSPSVNSGSSGRPWSAGGAKSQQPQQQQQQQQQAAGTEGQQQSGGHVHYHNHHHHHHHRAKRERSLEEVVEEGGGAEDAALLPPLPPPLRASAAARDEAATAAAPTVAGAAAAAAAAAGTGGAGGSGEGQTTGGGDTEGSPMGDAEGGGATAAGAGATGAQALVGEGPGDGSASPSAQDKSTCLPSATNGGNGSGSNESNGVSRRTRGGTAEGQGSSPITNGATNGYSSGGNGHSKCGTGGASNGNGHSNNGNGNGHSSVKDSNTLNGNGNGHSNGGNGTSQFRPEGVSHPRYPHSGASNGGTVNGSGSGSASLPSHRQHHHHHYHHHDGSTHLHISGGMQMQGAKAAGGGGGDGGQGVQAERSAATAAAGTGGAGVGGSCTSSTLLAQQLQQPAQPQPQASLPAMTSGGGGNANGGGSGGSSGNERGGPCQARNAGSVYPAARVVTAAMAAAARPWLMAGGPPVIWMGRLGCPSTSTTMRPARRRVRAMPRRC